METKLETKWIHLVALFCDYEGMDHPEAAFTVEADADALAAKMNKNLQSRSCRYEVISVEVKDGL